MIGTTLEMSRHLIEMGIDHTTADMHYAFSALGGSTFQEMADASATLLPGPVNNRFPYEPAWSLDALMELLPHEIDGYDLEIGKTYRKSDGKTFYTIGYSDYNSDFQIEYLISTEDESCLMAVYKSLEAIYKLDKKNEDRIRANH